VQTKGERTSLAVAIEVSSRSSTLPPMSGISPHLASMMLNRQVAVEKRKSHPRAICRPPPRHTPWTHAITGTGRVRHSQATLCAKFAMDPSGRRSSSALIEEGE
jgi:hypothetical protein